MLSSALPTRDVGLFDFTLRYQRTPCAKYHVRPLSLLQQEVLYRCDGMVTVADLADMTRYTHPEIRAVLGFLSQHGLIKTLPPDPTLFAPRPQASAPFPSRPRDGRKRRGPGGWNDRLWRWLTSFSTLSGSLGDVDGATPALEGYQDMPKRSRDFA